MVNTNTFITPFYTFVKRGFGMFILGQSENRVGGFLLDK